MRYLIALLVLGIIATGCDSKPPKKSRKETSEPAVVETTDSDANARHEDDVPPPKMAANPRKPVPDNSLTVAQYMKANVPDPASVWQPPQYKYAAEALAKIAKRDLSQLPRVGSPKSGALFARFVDPKNLSILRSSRLSLQDRLKNSDTFSGCFNPLLMIYEDAINAGSQFDAEYVELAVFGFEVFTVSIGAAEHLLEEVRADDPEKAKGITFPPDRVAKFKELMEKDLRQLAIENNLRQAPRIRFAKGLADLWSTIAKYMPESERTQIQELATNEAKSVREPKVKQAMMQIAEYEPSKDKKP